MSSPTSMFSGELVVPALGLAFKKLSPRELVRNPVLFTTAVVASLLTVLMVIGTSHLKFGFQLQLIVWLWLTVLFGTFAEALAEGRGRAQAASLRATRHELTARLPDGREVAASTLNRGDVVIVGTGDLIPADGEVIEGVASVNEAAITGESAPVIREAGGDRSAVTAGTRVISDLIKVRITQEPGQGFLDRMIALVEGAERQKTPNEIALTILLVGLTIIFLFAVATIPAFARYAGGAIPIAVLAALLITLIPTTIAALLSAIGIAGMDRLVRFNVLAKSGRAVEAGNMVDLDSDPTKLIEIVGLGKQLLMTRGALTTFSVANDVAKYFAIIPAMFVVLYPGLSALNVMHLASPSSAILSAIIFNALIIPALVPLALKGVAYRPAGAGTLLARNLAIYGAGGLVAPFIGIKAIDLIVSGLALA